MQMPSRTVWTKSMSFDINDTLDEVRQELYNATEKFGKFNTGHEGYAVILEELDELWDELKANRGSTLAAKKEAIQVAAMAVRYVVDVCL